MIVEWFLDLVMGFVDWFLGLFDDWELPSIFSSPPSEIYTVVGFVDSLGVWVPWAVITTVVVAVISVYAVMFIIKIVKQILAHVPAFGGAG